jgi:uncharacterized OB-fold protein
MSDLTGKVYSHTVIRVPGNVHAEAAPFVLLLVELDSGQRVLGHFAGNEPPIIDTRVAAPPSGRTPVFSVVKVKP